MARGVASAFAAGLEVSARSEPRSLAERESMLVLCCGDAADLATATRATVEAARTRLGVPGPV
jgi:hypothetical protein